MDVECASGGTGWGLSPHTVDECFGGDPRFGVEEEAGQNPSLRRPEQQSISVRPNGQRT